jgi:hypothetical protein
MSELELLPCPFCGKTAWMFRYAPEWDYELDEMAPEAFEVRCGACASRTWRHSSREGAARDWNTRHYPSQLRICATCKWMSEDGDDDVRWLKCSHADGGADVDLDDTCAHWEMKDED